ncbi:tRNA uridine-5-carboxymethylaminomethyl(34) synthesis GTPase MnmE, partial [Curvivirga aplysinae]|uniref:tRNA uridine-5-carboxymethylaminomethyl(34) synthesis GTPase MnmE n=1 Tax=Curvivirga aplysinae TaxID=2529852 RepID=UPI0012BD2C4C
MSGDTIFALASGKGRAGVSVIRISGDKAGDAVKAITGKDLPLARQAARRWFLDPSDSNSQIDDGLLIWFPGPNSFTGEDCAEIQGHGGLAVISAMLRILGEQSGLRLAEPGEFTRRAFQNGKMDLTEAEGLIDLIDAETEAQRKQALAQSKGALGALYEGWSERLKRILAYYEAEIDFADEDLPEDVGQRLGPNILALLNEMNQHLNDNRRGERLRDGVQVAIIGPPNAGKSSLLNTLAQREAAIVSDIAGTTRDIVEVHLDLGGYPVIISDTAGIREQTDDVIELEGIRRAHQAASDADLTLCVVDGSEISALSTAQELLGDRHGLIILNKSDKLSGDQIVDSDQSVYGISVKTGNGLDELLKILSGQVASLFGASDMPYLTRERHRQAVMEAKQALGKVPYAPEMVLAAEDIRIAMRALGRITGTVGVEELLDVIFR